MAGGLKAYGYVRGPVNLRADRGYRDEGNQVGSLTDLGMIWCGITIIK